MPAVQDDSVKTLSYLCEKMDTLESRYIDRVWGRTKGVESGKGESPGALVGCVIVSGTRLSR